MPSPNYIERAAAWLRSELGHVIQSELRDPRVGMVSITGISLSRDRRRAEIYVTVVGRDNAECAGEVLDVLNGASGYLQSRLASLGRMRTVPRLRFRYDPGVERGRRIDSLMAKVHKAQFDSPADNSEAS